MNIMENQYYTPPPTLSDRELQLIRHLAEGYSSKQVAEFLGITPHTVDTHRRNLIRKTGSRNTMELVVRCVRWGVV